ncbi:MAG: hypothetical protein O2923_01850 [Verrucomicrobia bacterium]|nr:hypothetical protein [Verrucomicrobiota bacterium]MDA1086810.1 hypothetical protein [Verrucomicrobiota bacterium]
MAIRNSFGLEIWKHLGVEQKLKYGGIAVAVVLAVVGIRWFQLRKYPIVDQEFLSSPNERSKAYLSHMSDKRFFGGSYDYYEIKVMRNHPNGGEFAVYEERIHAEDIPIPVDLKDIDRIVKWTRDSTIVMYHFGKLRIRVDMPL